MAVEPGDHLLVLLKTGEKKWRHSVVLSRADGVFHSVLTPSRAVRRLDFSGADIQKIAVWDGKNLPKSSKRENTFLDLDAAQGQFTTVEIQAAISRCDPTWTASSPQLAVEDGVPARRRVRWKTSELLKEEEKVSPRPDGFKGVPADGEGWYILVGCGAAVSGHIVSLKGVEHKVFGNHVLFEKAGATCHAVWAKAEAVTAELRKLRVRSSGHAAERFGDLDDIYRDAADTPRGGGDAQEKVEDIDVRVLPIHLEKDKRRFRRLADCALDYEEEDFWDWPLEGERSMMDSCTQLRREELSWLGHHERWLKHSGVRPNDRSTHEHLALCVALHHLATYDQVALPNLAGAEALDARRQLIEHAHERTPEMPQWDASEDFLGYRVNAKGTVINTRRVAYVAAKQGQRAKIIEATLKNREAQSAWLRRGQSAHAPGAGSGGAGNKDKPGKGGAKGAGADSAPTIDP